jgi:REP element-mobilizing transposase RayT
MERPMIYGYHVIFTTYGFWLPNDPRGSWSDFVAAWDLLQYGPATKTDTTVSVTSKPHDRQARKEAKTALKYPPVEFTGKQALAVGIGIWNKVHMGNYTVWACSILPSHVHMVVGRHAFKVEQMVNLMKGSATCELIKQDLHPFQQFKDESGRVPKCWARKEWKVFLDSEEDIERSIQYVQNNPLKDGKPAQKWGFVVPFAGVDV